MLKCQVMGTMPSSSVAISKKAPLERSSELLFLQVGQASATTAVTVLPFLVLVMVTDLPQSEDCLPRSP